jgi:hypothetical protein
MAVRPNTAARNGILDDGLAHFDGATLAIYTGTQPSAGGGATAETQLATGTLPTPAFAAASAGGRAPASNWSASIGTNGTAGWARLTKGSAIIDMDVGQGSGSLSLETVTLVDGDTVVVTGGSISLPSNDA